MNVNTLPDSGEPVSGRMVALLKKRDDTTTRTGIETAGSVGKMCMWVFGFGPQKQLFLH